MLHTVKMSQKIIYFLTLHHFTNNLPTIDGSTICSIE